jgi:hypothetical protein
VRTNPGLSGVCAGFQGGFEGVTPCSKAGGRLFYTVLIVVGRLNRKRNGLRASYHGKPGIPRLDYVVQTEYGADFWCEIFEAGFQEVTLTSLVFPASAEICVTKT